MIIHPKPERSYNHKTKLGYMHVYTGEGKGKTSAALGVLLRAAGQGHKVKMVQFLKGHKDAGELQAAQRLGKHVEIIQFGRHDLLSLDELQTVDAYFANQALQYVRSLVKKDRPDLLILDEITTAVEHELLAIQDVVDFLDNRHQHMEVVVTGRNAHPDILNLADLVTVMQPTKQYYTYDRFEPRLGIEH